MSEFYKDKGPWRANSTSEGKYFVESEDFYYDTWLYLDGDFGSEEEKQAYVEDIANQLNRKNGYEYESYESAYIDAKRDVIREVISAIRHVNPSSYVGQGPAGVITQCLNAVRLIEKEIK